MKKTSYRMYFGGIQPLKEKPNIRSDLQFDDKSVSNIAKMIFHGMAGGDPKKTQLSKQDMRLWTK